MDKCNIVYFFLFEVLIYSLRTAFRNLDHTFETYMNVINRAVQRASEAANHSKKSSDAFHSESNKLIKDVLGDRRNTVVNDTMTILLSSSQQIQNVVKTLEDLRSQIDASDACIFRINTSLPTMKSSIRIVRPSSAPPRSELTQKIDDCRRESPLKVNAKVSENDNEDSKGKGKKQRKHWTPCSECGNKIVGEGKCQINLITSIDHSICD